MNTKINFFEFYGYRMMVLNSQNIISCIEQLKLGHFDGFYISVAHGFDLKSIEFLGELIEIKALFIGDDVEIRNFESIVNLTNLEYLTYYNNRLSLNLIDLISLKILGIGYWNELIMVAKLYPQLEILNLRNFKPKEKNLECLEFAKNVKELDIIQSNLESLHGLEHFYKLSKAHFSYVPTLEDIRTLNPPRLVLLEFDSCKRIKNFEEVSKFKTLEILEIINCGTIPNLLFLDSMPKLRRFKFVKTNVLDGNLSPTLRLESVHTLGKRHYSHRPEQLPRSVSGW